LSLLFALTAACGLAGCSPGDTPVIDDASPRSVDDASTGAADSTPSDDSSQTDDGGQAQIPAGPPQPGPTPPDPAPYTLSAEELADGWISLFDGVSLFGWTKEKGAANWRVEDGVIVVDQGEAGFLATTSTFADYVLKVDFRAAEGTNSGVFLHAPKVPADPAEDCYELNIAPADNPFPTGSFVGRQKVEGDYTSTDWRTYEVRVLGDTVLVLLDGKEILAYTDPKPLWRGHILLQFREGKVEFRKIKLKPLELKPLLEGEDLAGWKKNGDSEFTASADGELHVKGGKGFLESEAFFGDFVLQLACKTNAAELNSGLFFRCIAGDAGMNGYESQIHNGFLGGDRTRPKDWGTGGIYRREDAKARRVVADDKEWFYKTIVADGPHIAVWVNGYQVTDWTDTRQPDDNPRRGLRTDPGTLMIQGHDPTTDILFRGIQAREMPVRSDE
jgi:hypothetical protein